MTDDEFLNRIVENEDFDPTADEVDRLIALARDGIKWRAAPEGVNEKHGRLMP